MIGYLNPPTKIIELGNTQKAISINTANKMIDIIRESSYNPYIRKWAETIIKNLPDRAENDEILSIYNFTKNHIRYVHDPEGMEYVQTPPYVLKQMEIGQIPMMDCDDYTVLSLSLLKSIGYRTALRLAGYKDKNIFSHVYGLVYKEKENKWLPFDAIRKDKWLGWEAPNALVVADFEV